MASVHRYYYRALDSSGNDRRGKIDSLNRSTALAQLGALGLTALELVEKSRLPISTWLGGYLASAAKFLQSSRHNPYRKPKRDSWMQFSEAMAALLRSGLTVERSLRVSVALLEAPELRSAVGELGRLVRQGVTLSKALVTIGANIPPYYESMLRAGEVGGGLADAMGRVAELLRSEKEIRDRIVAALIYPGLLLCVVLATLGMILTLVLPRFEVLFSESQAELPAATRAVLLVGRWTADYGHFALLSLAVVGISAWSYVRTGRGSRQFAGWLLRSQWTFGLPAAVQSARFLRTASTLCVTGVPLSQSIRISRGTVSNQVLSTAIEHAGQQVQAGQRFSSAMAMEGVFPPSAVQMVRVGEETGDLSGMLRSAAQILEEEAHRKMQRLLAVLVPLLTVGMGIVVAGLIGAVLIGLLSINDIAI